MKSLDTKLAQIKRDRSSRAFILADAKDADMAFGVCAGKPPPYQQPGAMTNSRAGRGNRPCTASSTQMSSSRFSQRNARQPTRRRTCDNSSGVALASNGYFAAGKLTRRCSASSSQMRRPSIQQRSAVAGDARSQSIETNTRGQEARQMSLFDARLKVTALGTARQRLGLRRPSAAFRAASGAMAWAMPIQSARGLAQSKTLARGNRRHPPRRPRS